MTVNEVLQVAGQFGVPVLLLWYILTKVMTKIEKILDINLALYRNITGSDFNRKEYFKNGNGGNGSNGTNN